jgi:LmbE family N-acetylglucosaminyl deacetylase
MRVKSCLSIRRVSAPAFSIVLGLVLLFCLFSAPARAQKDVAGETQLRLMLDELNNVGSVMMIAAHPDDENTALLAYLARGRHVRTAYLSLTRGEGGQNLIGPEQGDELGVIRTQELLAARRIDGAQQYFTRAIDFGFTKTATETLGTKWPREKVLGDVVWAIRRFQPDVIILRFTGTPRDGHGQHQSSAILGREAFLAAADPTRFPEQLKYVKTWQALRLMTNLAAFSREQQKEVETVPEKLAVDLGAYSPELGYSYEEIAGMSRSQHRSQAMGTAQRQGSTVNYFVTDHGDKATKDILEGINLGWSRLEGGAEVTRLLTQASTAFVPAHPEALLPILSKVRPVMAAVAASSKNPQAEARLAELDEAIALAGGVTVNALSDNPAVTPGGTFKITLSALARNPGTATLRAVKLSGIEGVPQPAIAPTVLALNKPIEFPVNIKVPESQSYSQPYWLQLPKENAMYSVPDPRIIGDPEGPPALSAEFSLQVGATEITLKRPVQRVYVDHIYGQLTRPLAIVPPVSVDFGGMALVFPDNKSRRLQIPVRSNSGKQAGEVRLEAPAGWKVEPASRHFELSASDEQTMAEFTVAPPPGESVGSLRASASVGDRVVAASTRVIDYPHIPAQTLFPASEARLVRSDIKTLAHNIGYVVGAGDEVPESLQQMGCEVMLLSANDLSYSDLSKYDAIVTGVRAFNTRADLRLNYQRLFKFVEDGGTLIVQYNVPEGGGPGATPPPESPFLQHIGPYPIKTGRDRVTVEEAPVSFPNPNNVLLHAPNEITARDFEGWVQERGLNFASEWDSRYQSILESHDPGEKELPGGELYTRYGKGAYIFSSYDWFRELPAGVPGAYRLFANMLSAAKVQ